jgi:hypothetical protein
LCEFHAYIKCPLDYLEEGNNISEICKKMRMSKRVILLKYREDFVVYIKRLISQGKKIKDIQALTGIGDRTVGTIAKEDEYDYQLTDTKISTDFRIIVVRDENSHYC